MTAEPHHAPVSAASSVMEWDDRAKALTVKVGNKLGGCEQRKIRFSGPLLPLPAGYRVEE